MKKYLLIVFAFVACQQMSKKSRLVVSTEALDTIKTVPAKVEAQPLLLETAFIKGTTQQGNTSVINLYGITVGKVKIPTGRIIACDPLHVDEYGIPYTQVFPTGEFPVQLSIANVQGEETVAFARINFSNEPVARWELALIKGQQPIPVGDKKIEGYGIDAGVGIFIDEAAAKAVDQSKLYGHDSELFREMEKHYRNDWRYAMYNFGQYNLVAFTTGLGDGRYAAYIGFDAAGKPCRLTTDFGLFNWRKK